MFGILFQKCRTISYALIITKGKGKQQKKNAEKKVTSRE